MSKASVELFKKFVIYAPHYSMARQLMRDFELNAIRTTIITNSGDYPKLLGLDNFVILCMAPLPQRLQEIVHSRRNVQLWEMRG